MDSQSCWSYTILYLVFRHLQTLDNDNHYMDRESLVIDLGIIQWTIVFSPVRREGKIITVNYII